MNVYQVKGSIAGLNTGGEGVGGGMACWRPPVSLVIPEDSKWRRSIQEPRAASHYCTTAFWLAREHVAHFCGVHCWPDNAVLGSPAWSRPRMQKRGKPKWQTKSDGNDRMEGTIRTTLSLSGKHWKERKYREWARCQNLLKKKKRKHKAWHATFICHWRDATANPLNRAGSEGKRNTAPDSQETQDHHWSVWHRQLLDNKHRLWKGWWVIRSLP